MRQGLNSSFRCKDFVETKEGLIFATLTDRLEGQRLLCFLRYRRHSFNNHLEKLSTDQANELLQQDFPEYYYHSDQLDADLHAVALNRISQHYPAADRLQQIMKSAHREQTQTDLQKKLIALVQLIDQQGIDQRYLGITGSLLIGAENRHSDIDLVVYDRAVFQQLRQTIKDLITRGYLSALDDGFWQDSYRRRGCDLSLEDYIWHEKKKYNKAVFQSTKFDISLVVQTPIDESNLEVQSKFVKQGRVLIQAKVIDDSYAFDTPAIYRLDHPSLSELYCFTPTYAGQAVLGDTIEVCGYKEVSSCGQRQRIIVGSSREARGEYIKRIKD